jgi:hypothetical protein
LDGNFFMFLEYCSSLRSIIHGVIVFFFSKKIMSNGVSSLGVKYLLVSEELMLFGSVTFARS